MKSKKAFKSLAELSADSIGAVNAEAPLNEPGATPSTSSQSSDKVIAEPASKIPPQSASQGSPVRGYKHWGINE